MRRPVNEPGPAPKAIPSSAARSRRASASNARTIGRSSSEWRCPAFSARSAQCAPSPSATAQTSVEASSARICMARFYLDATAHLSCPPLPVQSGRCRLHSRKASHLRPFMVRQAHHERPLIHFDTHRLRQAHHEQPKIAPVRPEPVEACAELVEVGERPKIMDTVVITALDLEGRGVARVDGKAIFVEGALIGERVAVEVLRRKPNYELARMVELHAASPARVAPPCPHFGICGGCSLQHLDPA